MVLLTRADVGMGLPSHNEPCLRTYNLPQNLQQSQGELGDEATPRQLNLRPDSRDPSFVVDVLTGFRHGDFAGSSSCRAPTADPRLKPRFCEI